MWVFCCANNLLSTTQMGPQTINVLCSSPSKQVNKQEKAIWYVLAGNTTTHVCLSKHISLAYYSHQHSCWSHLLSVRSSHSHQSTAGQWSPSSCHSVVSSVQWCSWSCMEPELSLQSVCEEHYHMFISVNSHWLVIFKGWGRVSPPLGPGHHLAVSLTLECVVYSWAHHHTREPALFTTPFFFLKKKLFLNIYIVKHFASYTYILH